MIRTAVLVGLAACAAQHSNPAPATPAAMQQPNATAPAPTFTGELVPLDGGPL